MVRPFKVPLKRTNPSPPSPSRDDADEFFSNDDDVDDVDDDDGSHADARAVAMRVPTYDARPGAKAYSGLGERLLASMGWSKCVRCDAMRCDADADADAMRVAAARASASCMNSFYSRRRRL